MSNQRGAVIVLFALSLPVLLGFTGFAVDVGNVFYQESRLQSIADSAVLAGGKSLSSNARVKLFSNDEYKNFKQDPEQVSSETATTVENFVQYNKNLKVDETINRSELEIKTDTKNEQKKYLSVVLNEKVDTYFAHLFGYDQFPVSVQAVAEVEIPKPPVTEKEKEETIQKINASIHKTIPDYYWETINRTYGKTNDNYNLSVLEMANPVTWSSDYYELIDGKYVYNRNVEKAVAAFRDPDPELDSAEDVENNFAQPLFEATPTNRKFSYIEFRFKNGYDFTKMKGVFLDLYNLGSKEFCRGMIFNIADQADEKIGDSKEPFFIRIESEPIKINDSSDRKKGGRTLVSPKIINVDTTTRRPMVIAYDGPDQSRTEFDAPIMEVYDPVTKTFKDIVTATTSTATFKVYLNEDFKGVIYAPRSHVQIFGKGKIDGLILGKKITVHDPTSTRTITETENAVEIPVWILERQVDSQGNKMSYVTTNYVENALRNNKYEKRKLVDKFMIAYDNFYNYTLAEDEN